MIHEDAMDVHNYVWQIPLGESNVFDGNYEDCKVGGTRHLCLSFYGDLSLTTECMKMIKPAGTADMQYFIVAEIVEIHGDAWVIDFGFRVASDRCLPDGATVGAFVAGEIGFWVDIIGYTYVRNFHSYESLFLKWLITQITKKRAPLTRGTEAEHQNSWRVDETKQALYEDVPALTRDITAPDEKFLAFIQTANAGGDVSGLILMQTSYIVHCQLVDGVA